jgi:hypothetical protein
MALIPPLLTIGVCAADMEALRCSAIETSRMAKEISGSNSNIEFALYGFLCSAHLPISSK